MASSPLTSTLNGAPSSWTRGAGENAGCLACWDHGFEIMPLVVGFKFVGLREVVSSRAT